MKLKANIFSSLSSRFDRPKRSIVSQHSLHSAFRSSFRKTIRNFKASYSNNSSSGDEVGNAGNTTSLMSTTSENKKSGGGGNGNGIRKCSDKGPETTSHLLSTRK